MHTKTCTKCGVTTALDSFNKKKSGKFGRSAECKSCSNARYAEWARQNPAAAKANVKRWLQVNGTRKKATDRAWRENNRERYRATLRDWHSRNPRDRIEYKRGWYAENRERYAIYNSRRRARILNACPTWADFDAIDAIYREAARLTRETGIPHEVDHIVPLQGRNVSGLHIPSNLQIITRSENRRKSNK